MILFLLNKMHGVQHSRRLLCVFVSRHHTGHRLITSKAFIHTRIVHSIPPAFTNVAPFVSAGASHVIAPLRPLRPERTSRTSSSISQFCDKGIITILEGHALSILFTRLSSMATLPPTCSEFPRMTTQTTETCQAISHRPCDDRPSDRVPQNFQSRPDWQIQVRPN